MRLNDSKIKSLKPLDKAKKLSDGGGLHIVVTPAGGKLWRLAYRFGGKQKQLAIGSYPAISVAGARRKRDEAKELLSKGIDPSRQKRLDQLQKRTNAENTFHAIASEYLERVKREGRAETTMKKKCWLVSLALPDIGDRPISEISAPEILVALRRIESDGNYETARRLRSTIGQVFRYAVATSRATGDPTTSLKGALITPKPTHRAAITSKGEFAGLVQAVWGYQGSPETCAAMKLLVLLYPRPGELRLAQWDEFDIEQKNWTIPASRTKMRREHKKPLPTMALNLLDELSTLSTNSQLVFRSLVSTKKPISENTLNLALRRMGYTKDQATSHGFRASASSLLNESGLWNPDAIEAELGHLGADQVRRAYHRATYWEERVRMADWWANEVARFVARGSDETSVES